MRLRWFLCLFYLAPAFSAGYSVLTHEQLIDLSWKAYIEPLLRSRFPQLTSKGLIEAQAYAYGGCAIQDMGYYPFGKELFSDLTHYVRTGDFIRRLLENSRTADEYAFALGALAHYIGDNIGHRDAINPSTARNFSKLAKQFGPSITYDQAPHAHIRTEFAFDIAELGRHRLAPAAYFEFVGLRVPRPLLERAFFETYSLRLREVLGSEAPAIRSYRSAVRGFLPAVAHAETLLHRDQIPDELSSHELSLYLERINKADFQTVWNQYRRTAGVKTHILAAMIWILPKIGPLSDLAIKMPNPQSEAVYVTSVNRTVELFQNLLGQLKEYPSMVPAIPNRDLDTGETTRPGAYTLTDQTYAKLLDMLTANAQHAIAYDLQQDIVSFYADPAVLIRPKANTKAWTRLRRELTTLRQMPTLHYEMTKSP